MAENMDFQVSPGFNPLTGMDYPDPDVIRVGDTYYLVSTTMHFSPSCAILKSHDLLNWVWGPDYFGSDRVVDSHIKKLRKALGSAGAQIKTQIGRGYRLTKE